MSEAVSISFNEAYTNFYSNTKGECIEVQDVPANSWLIDGDGSSGSVYILYNIVETDGYKQFDETEHYFDTIKEAKAFIKSVNGKLLKHHNSSY